MTGVAVLEDGCLYRMEYTRYSFFDRKNFRHYIRSEFSVKLMSERLPVTVLQTIF